MVPPSFEPENRFTLTSVPTHTLPLTRAHGPDTPGSLPFPLSLSEPFAGEPSAGFQLPPLSVGVPSGLTFASKVSVFVIEHNTDQFGLSTAGLFFGCFLQTFVSPMFFAENRLTKDRFLYTIRASR